MLSFSIKDVKMLIAAIMLYAPIEYVYLTNTAQNWYIPMFQAVQAGRSIELKLQYSIFAYVPLIIAWYVLILRPLLDGASLFLSTSRSILYALAVYGVFNATCLTVFQDWDARISLYDTLWGMFSLTFVTVSLHALHTHTGVFV